MRSIAKPKILVLASTFPRWRGDTDPPFVHHLCRGLSAHFEVHVLAPHYPGAACEELLDGIQVHRYRYAPVAWQTLAYDGGMLRKIKKRPLLAFLLPAFLGSQWLALRRLHAQQQFALIHAHWIIPQGLIAALSPGPFLLTSHGGDLYALNHPLLRALKRWIAGKALRLTVVSTAMVAECMRLGVARDRIAVCSMGVDTRTCFVPPDKTDAPARRGILCVGRLVEKKGLPVLVGAIHLLQQRGISVELTIIGDGPERANLQQLVAEKGLGELIHFLGARKNAELPRYYQQAQIFVLPSIISRDGDQEGLGLVSVEAMACGCPVIASDLPAVRDVIIDEVDGLLVEPGSSEALAAAIERLLSDADLCAGLAEAGLRKAARFDWTTICETYSGIISAAIAAAPRH